MYKVDAAESPNTEPTGASTVLIVKPKQRFERCHRRADLMHSYIFNFYWTQVSLGSGYGSDVTLADEDTNSIPSDEANKAMWRHLVTNYLSIFLNFFICFLFSLKFVPQFNTLSTF